MRNYTVDFKRDGAVILPSALSDKTLERIVNCCEDSIGNTVGTRNLLKFNWAKNLAERLKAHSEIRSVLGSNSRVIQCNYFSKNAGNNWYVTLHRDLSIPVAQRITSDKWSGWSVKEGQLYVQPPRAVLESLVAIRIHFEDNNEDNGVLQVIKGSHRPDHENSNPAICRVNTGDALMISPLILHKSAKLKFGTRRVLHFVFGPYQLPDGAAWPSERSN